MTAYTVLIASERAPEPSQCRPKLYSRDQASAYAKRLMKIVPCTKTWVREEKGATPNCEFMAGRLWWD